MRLDGFQEFHGLSIPAQAASDTSCSSSHASCYLRTSLGPSPALGDGSKLGDRIDTSLFLLCLGEAFSRERENRPDNIQVRDHKNQSAITAR